MFGENTIIVSKTIRIDNKRRIVLPVETGAVLSDKICFMHDLYRTKLYLFQKDEFDKKLDAIIDKLKEKRVENLITYTEYRRYVRYICGILCFSYEEVDKQRRLLLPENAYKNLALNDTAYIEGKETHLELYSSEDKIHRK